MGNCTSLAVDTIWGYSFCSLINFYSILELFFIFLNFFTGKAWLVWNSQIFNFSLNKRHLEAVSIFLLVTRFAASLLNYYFFSF